jgi:uncharacterized protein YbjT (DUF2867 family)
LEDKVKELEISYSIIRLPLFLDNFMGNANSIADENTFYDPRDPSKPFTPVVVGDVGKASAAILANPTPHNGHTYTLASPSFSLNDLAKAFSKQMDKKVTVTTVHYNAAKESMLKAGLPEWQVNGIVELFHMIDEGSDKTNVADVGDIERITGEKSTTMEAWVEQNIGAFLAEV